MISLRNAPNSSNPGKARYLVFDEGNLAERELTQKRWADSLIAGFQDSVMLPNGVRQRSGDILFLVHGFNVGRDDAKAFHLKCAASLAAHGWNGKLVSYDWPSDGLVFAYVDDRTHARAAASALVQSGIDLFESRLTENCTINVHVMAHSMGCFVTQQAFNWAYQDVPVGWRVGQILMVAADVDHTVFSADNLSAKNFCAHSARLTAYCDRFDKALAISNAKRLELAPRMGRVGLPDDSPSVMCEVDCSALFETVHPDLGAALDPSLTHSFYFAQSQFWSDAVLTLKGEIDRQVFPTREPLSGARVPNRFNLKG